MQNVSITALPGTKMNFMLPFVPNLSSPLPVKELNELYAVSYT